MPPRVGSIDAFNPSVETITSYLERLDAFFITNDIGIPADNTAGAMTTADRKKVACLITVIGPKTYSTLQDMCKPDAPNAKTFPELTKILTDYFQPKKLEVAESFQFHRCQQNESESVSEFCARLRRLASTCGFGNFLPRSLRDQFVSGVRNTDTQKKLLQEDRDFDACLTIALADEAAVRGSKTLSQQAGSSSSIHYVDKKRKEKVATGYSHRKTDRKPAKPAKSTSKNYTCYSCGDSSHMRDKCQFRNATCNKCDRQGHISKVCKQQLHLLQADESENSDNDEFESFSNPLFTINSANSKPITLDVSINHHPTKMQLDTGSALSVAPMSFYKKYCSNLPLHDTKTVLTTYSGQQLSTDGLVKVDVNYNGQQKIMKLHIISQGVCALFGRDWLSQIQIDWKEIANGRKKNADISVHSVSVATSLEQVLEKHSPLFSSGLGCYNGPPISFSVTKDAPFFKARNVPYAIQPQVERALNKMETDGVIKKVSTATTAAPIVPVEKKNGEIRVCGDFSVTFNSVADVITYPIPKIDDIQATFRGCKVYTVLDMRQAYHQLPIADDSQKHLVINTKVGLYAFLRMPNGIHSGPAIFQKTMDTVLAGIPKVLCYIDDILIGGTDEQDHLNTLSTVLERLQSAGFRLNKEKCEFQKPSVQYLSHVIDGEGLHPTADKIAAIQNATTPKDVHALKSFLGLLMFYSKFLPHHSSVLAPLNKLLGNDVPWKWGKTEEKAFLDAKKLLLDSPTLVHYDDSLPLFLSCDASYYGAGAVLSHNIDGYDRPIAFASCTLTSAQRNYSQLDKEAFSIIFGLTKFHQYIYGRRFTIITDHKPLLTLLGPQKPAPVQAAARLQRWSLILAAYNYDIQYRRTTEHANADSMSRVPVKDTWDIQTENIDCLFFESQDIVTVISSDMVRDETQKDPLLSHVFRYTMQGWPSVVDPELVPFKSRQNELTIDNGCLLWGTRVIIPKKLRDAVLLELHETHQGITKTKMLARCYVWWPQMDNDIEHMIQTCNICQARRSEPAKATVHPWTYPSGPWNRVHIDFATPQAGTNYLVIIDAFSKYPEVTKMKSTTTTATIVALQEVFSRHGIPETLVSDNGPQFKSHEFKLFCQSYGIIHKTCAPYKPATNGQAERVVQILKTAIKIAELQGKNEKSVILDYLLMYRSTPHCTTGQSPAQLLMGRRLRTKLDLLFPCVNRKVEKEQSKMVDKNVHPTRSFIQGDSVLARNYGSGPKWTNGIVTDVLGSRHYSVHVDDRDAAVKRHVDQVISVPSTEDIDASNVDVQPVNTDVQTSTSNSIAGNVIESEHGIESDIVTPSSSTQDVIDASPIVSRYPSRNRNAPSYMKDYVSK